MNNAGQVDDVETSGSMMPSPEPPEHHRQTSSSSHRSNRSRGHRGRKRGSDHSDADAQKKQELREQRRAQTAVMRGSSQEMDGEQVSSAMIGDDMNAADVHSVPQTSGLSRHQSSGSRGGHGRGGHSRPENKNRTGGPPTQVGAVATTGRAYGAAPRRNHKGELTQSIAFGDGSSGLTQEELDQLTPKEAMAMNVQTVEDYEAEEKKERRRQQKLKEETKRLKKDIASSKPQSKPGPIVVAMPDVKQTSENDDDESDDDDDKSDDSSSGGLKRIILVVGVLALLIGTGCAAYFLTKGKGGETAAPIPSTPNPTSKAPVSTPPPTIKISLAPTLSPTKSSTKYDPPSEEDCAAIEKGEAIEGQEDLPQIQFVVTLDCSISLNTDMQLVAEELQLEIQRRIILELVGCIDPVADRKLLKSRQSSNDDPLRYAIANSKVVNVRESSKEECQDPTSNWHCYRMEVIIDTFVKGDEAGYMLKPTIDQAFSNIKEKLGFGAPYQKIELFTINVRDATPAPSASSTMMPTIIGQLPSTTPPTESPSQKPTWTVIEPTNLPTESPTNAPTKKPTRAPTNNPTKRPTNSPTRRPTNRPTARPVARETLFPTFEDEFEDGGQCIEDLATNEDDLFFDDEAEDLLELIPCSGTNPIVAYLLDDLFDCTGTCLAKLDLSSADPQACNRLGGAIPVLLPGEYYNSGYVTIFQAKDSVVTTDCSTTRLVLYTQAVCNDLFGFRDSSGNGCTYYNQNYGPLQCPEDAAYLFDAFGFSPFEACCRCGGGTLNI